jgi:hypothetical protein
VTAAQTLNVGWQIAAIARHLKVTNEQVIAAIANISGRNGKNCVG